MRPNREPRLHSERAIGCGHAFHAEPFAEPDAPRKRGPDRAGDVLRVMLDIAVDPAERRVQGRVVHRIRVLFDTAEVFTLDAVALEIAGCRVDGAQAGFSYDGERLQVRPAVPPKRGAECEIEISYSGSPVRGLWFVAPDAHRPDKPLQAWTQGQDDDARFWFPCFDHPGWKAPSEVRASVPAGFTAVSNGALISREVAGDRVVYRWRQAAPHPTYLVTLVVGRFDVVEDRAGDVPLAYHVPVGRGGDAHRTFGRTPAMIALFGKLFSAPYPFEKYDQLVVSDFIFGGMENTTATTLYEWVMLDRSVEDATDSDWLIAHELGHQWFGDLLTCRHWPEAWLNEGFATYCESLWYEFGHDRERGRRHLLETARGYFEEARGSYRRAIVCDKYDAPTDLFDRHLYEKGACVLHHLRSELGDDAFFRAIGRYVAAHRGGSVETVDLRRAVEAETGRNVDAFFSQWVESPGHPEFSVRHAFDPVRRRLTLTVKQTQKTADGTPIFATHVRCKVWFSKSEVERTFEVTGAEHRFHWELAEDPVGVRFASDGAPLFVIDFERPDVFLITQLERDDDLLGRVEAAEALAVQRTPAGVAALAKAFRKETRWTHAVEFAALLGRTRTPEARVALVAGTSNALPRIRAAAATALGRFREPAAAAALQELLEHEPHPLVRAAARRGLGRTREASGLPLLREEAAHRGSWNDVVPRAALEGLAEARARAEEPAVRAELAQGRPDLVRAAAARALADLYVDVEVRTPARETIEALLDDSFHVVRAAIGALRTLGDVRAAGALDALAARRFLDGRLKRAARLAAKALRNGEAPQERLSLLRDRADKAETEMRKLTERIEALERPRGASPARKAAPARKSAVGRKRTSRGKPDDDRKRPPRRGRR